MKRPLRHIGHSLVVGETWKGARADYSTLHRDHVPLIPPDQRLNLLREAVGRPPVLDMHLRR
jgi:hypothetical protein